MKAPAHIESATGQDDSAVPLLQEGETPRSFPAALWAQVRGLFAGVTVQRRQRHLRLCETLSLGEKRILAVIECDGKRLLISATPQHISLLQSLDGAPENAERSSPRP